MTQFNLFGEEDQPCARCVRCGASGPVKEFARVWGRGRGYCRKCQNESVRAWKKADPDHARRLKKESRERHIDAALKRSRTWREENRDRVRELQRLRHYGLTSEDYEELVQATDGRCYICGDLPAPGKCLHIDHDHSTGFIRGLLCTRCNTGLGLFRDDVLLLKEAMQYLFDSADEQAEGEAC